MKIKKVLFISIPILLGYLGYVFFGKKKEPIIEETPKERAEKIKKELAADRPSIKAAALEVKPRYLPQTDFIPANYISPKIITSVNNVRIGQVIFAENSDLHISQRDKIMSILASKMSNEYKAQQIALILTLTWRAKERRKMVPPSMEVNEYESLIESQLGEKEIAYRARINQLLTLLV